MHTPQPITGTILIIDREDRLPKQRAILEQAGFTVIAANSASEGLATARAKHPDLVISEVMLEKPDAGFVLSYRMKSDPALAETPLMLVSSVFQTTGRMFDLNSPNERKWIKADAYLERPVAPEQLVAKVRDLLLHAA